MDAWEVFAIAWFGVGLLTCGIDWTLEGEPDSSGILPLLIGVCVMAWIWPFIAGRVIVRLTRQRYTEKKIKTPSTPSS